MAVRKGYNRFFIIFQEEDKGFGIAIDKQPTGYAKIEVRNGKCKITVYVQNLKREKAPYYFCMMDTVKPPPLLVRLGEIKVDDTGKGETWWEYNDENIAETSKAVDRFDAAIIVTEGEEFPTPLMGFTGKEKPGWKQLLINNGADKGIKNEHSKLEEVNLERKLEDENVIEAEPVALNTEIGQVALNSEGTLDTEGAGALDAEGKRFKEYEESLLEQMEASSANANANADTNTQETISNDTIALKEETINVQEQVRNIDEPLEERMQGEVVLEDDNDNQNSEEEDVTLWEQPLQGIDEDILRHKKHKEKKSSKWADKFHKILEEYQEVENPFEDEDEDEHNATRWWMIPYKNSIKIKDEEQYPFICTIFHLNMVYPYIDYIKYFYDRGYYYFGMKYDDTMEVKYIIYGIEGNPVLREQPCMGMTGFFKCIKLKNRNMGAWVMIYNPKTGNFMVEKNN